VRYTAVTRLTALVVGLLMGLAAPGLAVAHGVAHAHLAHEHQEHAIAVAGADHTDRHEAEGEGQGDEDAHRSSQSVAPSEHRHGHDHATVNVAPTGRDLSRSELVIGSMAVPTTVERLWTVTTVRSPALHDRALLARPAPDSGPPPTLRAPPSH
jgi:hypothetical protein